MPTTTLEAIRAQHVTLMQALVPTTKAGVKFVEYVDRNNFEDWAVAKPSACMRRFQFKDLGPYDPAVVSDLTQERVITNLQLVVAYPNDMRFQAGEANDAFDVVRQDMHQLNSTIGDRGYGNFVDGHEKSSPTTPDEFEVVDGTILLRIDFETRFWRAF